MKSLKQTAHAEKIKELNDRAVDAMLRAAHPGIRRAMKILRRPEARIGILASPIGRLMVAEGPRGFATIHFLSSASAERPLEKLRRNFDLLENEAWRADINRELARYFAGDFSVLGHKVDLVMVESEFQRRALTRLREVPIGSVITYQGLAAAVGEPGAQRAIGNTMASNPIPIFIPCHRVIRSDGTIGNYGGGVKNKVTLLRNEGFALGTSLRMPASAVMGHRHTHIYCRPECSAAKRADPRRSLIFADARHAIDAGLRACKLCKPG
ncbi:MAG: methylated-DNA--[protein]-cysteine S-methyltransferase [Candidatus Binataceae bacterium]